MLPLKKYAYRSVNWNLEAIKTPLNELSFRELHHHPTSFRITATAAASRDAGCAFSIAWMERKGEKLDVLYLYGYSMAELTVIFVKSLDFGL